jgi:hypothetical protein
MALHQYMPLLPSSSTSVMDLANPLFRDPLFSASRFPAIRRIELMQRLATAGRVTPTLPDIEALLYDKWRDPIAGCLGGYLLVRMGRRNDLDIPTQNLTTYFSGLSDSHVLRGAWLELNDTKAALRSYRAALDRGLPVFSDGLALLRDAIRRHNIIHDRVLLLEDLVSHVSTGALWSASPFLVDILANAAPLGR